MKKVFGGIFFILGAALILASGMDLLPGVAIKSLLWTIPSAALLIWGITKGSFFGMFFAIAFLAIIYAEPLGIVAITPWPVLGAALLLSIGFRMIFPKRPRHEININGEKENGPWVQVTYNGEDCKDGVDTEEKHTRDDGDYLEFAQVFKSGTKYINTDNLKRVDVECVFSTLEIYFDNAVMRDEYAAIELECVFSTVTLYVPRTWGVVEKSENVFGKITYEGRAEAAPAHKLKLKGSSVFSKIHVVYI